MRKGCNEIWGFRSDGDLSWIDSKHTKIKKHVPRHNGNKDILGFNPELGKTEGWYGTWARGRNRDVMFDFH